MDNNLRQMINNIAEGDMAAAGDAFMAAAESRRSDAWVQAKTDYAQRAFKEVDLGPVSAGQDTGIYGDPAEVDEAEKLSGVDQATMAHVKGDIEKRDAILKNRAKHKAKERDAARAAAKKPVDEQRPSASEIRKMSGVDQATQAHVSGNIEKRDAILKTRAKAKAKERDAARAK